MTNNTAAASNDATLTGLALANAADDAAVTLAPAFAADTTSYTASVDNAVAQVTVTPTLSDANATLAYLDGSDTALADADTAKTATQVDLDVGSNTIKVQVTAEDAHHHPDLHGDGDARGGPTPPPRR